MTKEMTPSQRKVLADKITESRILGVRLSWILEESGRLFITVAIKPRTESEIDLAARYGTLLRSFIIRRSGKIIESTMDPDSIVAGCSFLHR